MNNMGMRILWELPAREMNENQVWSVAGFARGIESFQTCILLAERGALAEARALARLCAETVIVTAGLLKVEGTLDKLHADGAKHKLSLCNRMLEINAGSGKEELLARYEEEKAQIFAEFGNDPRPLKLAPLAHEAGLDLLYELSYRLTSGNGAHATIGAFERHMVADKDGYLDQYVFAPDASDMRSTLLAANAAMSFAASIIVNGDLFAPALDEFSAKTRGARFLASKEVADYLEELRNNASELQLVMRSLQGLSITDEQPAEYGDRFTQITEWFQQQLEVIPEKFAPFLSVDDI